METYKYSIGDTFVLPFDPNAVVLNVESQNKDTINYVLYTSNELLIVLQNHIDSVGNILDNWTIVSFDLTIKKTLEFLSILSLKTLPMTKYGALGTYLMYGEDEYTLGGITLKSLSTMTFKKPLLIQLYKISEAITDDVETGSSNYQSTLLRVWDSSTKIPLESDKNILLTVIEEPKLPLKKYSKIEVEVESETPMSDALLPPLRNVIGIDSFTEERYKNMPPEHVLIGMRLFDPIANIRGFNDVSFDFMTKPFNGAYRANRETANFSGFGGFNSLSKNNGFIMTEGQSIFPKWKLQSDNTFPIGTGLKDGNKYSTVLCKVVVVTEEEKRNRFAFFFSIDGKINQITKYENQYLFTHPQIFLGGNVNFKESKNDLFLILGNQPLVGTKSARTQAIFNKTITSSQFPLKTRTQISKSVRVQIEEITSLNRANYEFNKGELISTTYFPKSYQSFLELNAPDLFQDLWALNNYAHKQLSWKSFNLLKGSIDNSSNQNLDKVLEYFDYEKLNEIQATNPLLYQKLNSLIRKSVNIYLQNLPSKTAKQSNIISRDYFKLLFFKFTIRVESTEPYTTTDATMFLDSSVLFQNNDVIYTPKFQAGDNRNYEEGLISLINEMQKRAEGRTDKFGHPYLSYQDLEYFKPLIWAQYLYPLNIFTLGSSTYKLSIDFNNLVFSFASNYYAYTELTDNGRDFLNIAPTILIETNKVENWSKSIVSIIETPYLNVDLRVGFASDEQQKETKNIFAKIGALYVSNIDTLLKMKSLDVLLSLFAYYDIMSKKMDHISIGVLHHDVRFKNMLLEASVLGLFTKSTIPQLIKYIKTLNECIQELADLYSGNQGTRINAILKLPEGIVNWEDESVNLTYLVESFENSFFPMSSRTSISTGATLLMTYRFEEELTRKLELMKENELVGKLIIEETTPRAEWLKMFGLGDVSTSLIEDEEEEEETIEEAEEDEFDLDSLDVDDIEIDLSDDEILEDNIEI